MPVTVSLPPCLSDQQCFALMDLRDAYWSLKLTYAPLPQSTRIFVIHMGDHISDDSSTDEETRREHQRLYPILRTTEEEREYGTIPGSVPATLAALAHRTAQPNPLVPRGKLTPAEKRQAKAHSSARQHSSGAGLCLVPRSQPSVTNSQVCTML